MQITLNLTPNGYPPKIDLKQYDQNGKTLTAYLIENGTEYSIPSGSTVIWQGTKPDGYGFSYACTYNGSLVNIPITTQSTAVHGKVKCELMIESGADSSIRTATAIMVIAKAALDTSTIISGDDYQSLQAYVTAAAESAAAAETSATSAAESVVTALSYKDDAELSATSASDSATDADASATAANTAKAGAETAQESAATSATAASNSASASATKANESAASAASAAASADLASSIAQGQKGWYGTPALLRAAHPTGVNGDWAIVGSTDTNWFWDSDTSDWKDSFTATDLSNYYTKSQSSAQFSTKTELATTNTNVSNIIDGTTAVGEATHAVTADSATPTSHASTTTEYGKGDLTHAGHLYLSDAINSSEGVNYGVAATPYAVKLAYDKANNAMPKSGGTFTGNVMAQTTLHSARGLYNCDIVAAGEGNVRVSTGTIVFRRK